MLYKFYVLKGFLFKLYNLWDGLYYIIAECLNNIYSFRKCLNNKVVKFWIYVNWLKYFENLDFCKVFDLLFLIDSIDDFYLLLE